MKFLILSFLVFPIICCSQDVLRFQKGLGVSNDTLYFHSFTGVNYDTSYYNIDIDHPSQLKKFEASKRFKADSLLIKKIENKISTNYVDCNNTFPLQATHPSYGSDKKKLDSLKSAFKKVYHSFNRRYFGYVDSTGDLNIIIKFVPKGTIQVIGLGPQRIKYITTATLCYNVKKDCVWFANN